MRLLTYFSISQTKQEGQNYFLTIHKACLEDTGLFSVKAENESGYGTCDANITVICE